MRDTRKTCVCLVQAHDIMTVCLYIRHMCVRTHVAAFLSRKGGWDLLGINRRWTNKGSPSLSVVIGESVWLWVLDDEEKMDAGVQGFSYSWVCGAESKQISRGKDIQGVYDEYPLLFLTQNDLIFRGAVSGPCSIRITAFQLSCCCL